MNNYLKTYALGVKSKCLKLGFNIEIHESGRDTHALLSNSDANRVVMVVVTSNVLGDLLTKAYLINQKKYEWAVAEGFSLDEMVDLVQES